MRRIFTITIDDKTHILLKKLSQESEVPMSRLIERAILEKYGEKEKKGEEDETRS